MDKKPELPTPSSIEAIADLARAGTKTEVINAKDFQGLCAIREPGVTEAKMHEFGYRPVDATVDTPEALVTALQRHGLSFPRPLEQPAVRTRQLDANTANVYIGASHAVAVLDALQSAAPRYTLPMRTTAAWDDFCHRVANKPLKPLDLLIYLRSTLRGCAPIEFVHALRTTKWTNNQSGFDQNDGQTHSLSREALKRLVTEAGEALPETVVMTIRVCAVVPYVTKIECAVVIDFENFRISLAPCGADPIAEAELQACATLSADIRQRLDAASLTSVPIVMGFIGA